MPTLRQAATRESSSRSQHPNILRCSAAQLLSRTVTDASSASSASFSHGSQSLLQRDWDDSVLMQKEESDSSHQGRVSIHPCEVEGPLYQSDSWCPCSHAANMTTHPRGPESECGPASHQQDQTAWTTTQ